MIITDNRVTNRQDLSLLASKLSSALKSLFLHEGDVIAVMLRNCQEYLETILACRQIGSYYCPINWHFTLEETLHILNDSEAKALIIHADILERLNGLIDFKQPIIIVNDTQVTHTVKTEKNSIIYDTWRDSFQEDNVFSPSPRGHMAYTSGTTGSPKGVVRHPVDFTKFPEKKQLLDQVVEQAFGITQNSKVLLPAPLYHSAPSLFTQHALQKSSLFILLSKFDPINLLKTIEQYKIEVVYLVPIMFIRLLKLSPEIRSQYDISSVKFVASTGAPCPIEVKQQMIEWFGPVIYETYASSEAGLITVIDSNQALKKPGSAGLPIGKAVIKIYDDNNQECQHSHTGRVYVRQYSIEDFHYKNNPTARSSIDKDGLIHLGDMGYLDEDGFLFICDRQSDMVISGGVNIYPAEIESHIIHYPGISDCAVIGIPDEEFGESLMAFIQLSTSSNIDIKELKAWLSQRIAKYKIPKNILIENNLPRDDNGKIYKRRLREKFWEGKNRKV